MPVQVVNGCSHIALTEWQAADFVLSSEETASLLRCPPDVMQMQILPGGKCRLQARSVVGQLRVGRVHLSIQPKHPIPSLLAMLVEVHELVHLVSEPAIYGVSPDIVDLLAQMFLHQVRHVLQQGLRRTYRENEEDLLTVRGRIHIRPTAVMHLRGLARVQCEFEDYTLDGWENRSLLSALLAIAACQILPLPRRTLARSLAAEFVGVAALSPSLLQSKAIRADRLNSHYHPALELADLIREGLGVAHDFGVVEGNGFLINMNWLFERFVLRRLEKLLLPNRITVSAQQSCPFDKAEQAQIRPDLVIRSHNGRRLAADTKYKLDAKPAPSDLYQIFTYCRVLHVRCGILITVGSGPDVQYDVQDGRTKITVFPVDLTDSLAGIDGSFVRLSKVIASQLDQQFNCAGILEAAAAEMIN